MLSICNAENFRVWIGNPVVYGLTYIFSMTNNMNTSVMTFNGVNETSIDLSIYSLFQGSHILSGCTADDFTVWIGDPVVYRLTYIVSMTNNMNTSVMTFNGVNKTSSYLSIHYSRAVICSLDALLRILPFRSVTLHVKILM